MSPEERRILEERIRLSGLSKQDYMIQSSLYQQIRTVGNVKSFEEIRREIRRIEESLYRLTSAEELEVEKLESLRMILEMLTGLAPGDEKKTK